MKYKASEVTNSSSTSFMVYIPPNLDIRKFLHLIPEQIHKDYEDQSKHYDGAIDPLSKLVVERFEMAQEYVSSSVYDESMYQSDRALMSILQELDLIIDEWDSCLGGGQLINIGHSTIQDGVKNIKEGNWGIRHGGWGSKDGDTI